ncbi:hypothetical protein G9A89_008382 [Geosiphon pyriformis]|nr:hypothetical protein G9A89_008382 [Geosiphon pyriformis]
MLTLLYPNDTTANLSTTSILSSNLLANNTHHLSTAAPTYLSATASNARYTQNPNAQHYLSFLVISEDTSLNNQELNQNKSPTSNILLVTITNDKSLAAIFPFEFKKPSQTLLFSRTVLKEKPITAMYTNAKVDGQAIKLILDSGLVGSIIIRQLMDQLGHQVNHTASAKIITTNGAMKTLIGKIDEFPFEINGLIMPIKVLVMEVIQIANVKAEGITTSKLLEIKNNPLSLFEPEYVQTFDIFGNIKDNLEEFHKHYQQLAPTKKEQEQHLEHNNNKDIMPEHVHNTDVGFNLRYLGKDVIKLESYFCTYIDLKVALEIPATTMIQLASRTNLAKKRINIRERIIDTRYVGNIIAML